MERSQVARPSPLSPFLPRGTRFLLDGPRSVAQGPSAAVWADACPRPAPPVAGAWACLHRAPQYPLSTGISHGLQLLDLLGLKVPFSYPNCLISWFGTWAGKRGELFWGEPLKPQELMCEIIRIIPYVRFCEDIGPRWPIATVCDCRRRWAGFSACSKAGRRSSQ